MPPQHITRVAILGAALLFAACRAPAADPSPAPAVAPAQQRAAAVPPSIGADIAYLASDALEGRGTGTPGNDSAAVFIARRFAALGLEPASGQAIAAACGFGATRPCAEAYLQRFAARAFSDVRAGHTEGRPTQNVVALIRGTDPALRGQAVIVGAHFDHLGRAPESSLDPQAGTAIRPGADDNASGTAVVLDLARTLAASPPRRSVLLVLFSGEELGLLGSLHFVTNAPIADDSVQAMVNFDMVGRLRNDRLIVYGTGTATEMPALVDSANTGAAPLTLAKVPDGFGPSDHASFYAKGIPVLHLFTDLHEEYHRATDVPSTVNLPGTERVARYAERVTRLLADRDERLTPIRVAVRTPPAGASSSGAAVYFGSIPDMAAAEGVTGLRLTGVSPGSPADRAGLKGGDVIVSFDGKPVSDLYDYTDALRARTPGDVVEVLALRDGQRLTFTATLGSRGG